MNPSSCACRFLLKYSHIFNCASKTLFRKSSHIYSVLCYVIDNHYYGMTGCHLQNSSLAKFSLFIGKVQKFLYGKILDKQAICANLTKSDKQERLISNEYRMGY